MNAMQDNEWFAGAQDSDAGKIICRGRLFPGGQREFAGFPMRVEIQWQYSGKGTDGMPDDKEAELTDQVMNALTDRCERKGIALLTAVHTGARLAWYVYYCRSVDDMSACIDDIFSAYPPLPVRIGAVQDTGWSDYKKLLSTFSL